MFKVCKADIFFREARVSVQITVRQIFLTFAGAVIDIKTAEKFLLQLAFRRVGRDAFGFLYAVACDDRLCVDQKKSVGGVALQQELHIWGEGFVKIRG